MKNTIVRLNINKTTQEMIPDKFEDLFLIDIENSDKPPASYLFEDCCIFICLDGYQTMYVNEREYEISPNSVFIIPPNHLIRKVEGIYNFRAKGLFFPVDLVNNYFQGKEYNLRDTVRKISFFSIVDDEKMKEIIEYYSFLEKQYEKPVTAFSSYLISNLVFALLVKIVEIYSLTNAMDTYEDKPHKRHITERFFDLVGLNYKEQRSLSFYADKMCLSPKYLSATIKNTTGRPALIWINEYVVQKAKDLIKTSDMTYSEISEYLNLPNQSFFSRLFKRYTGMTPKEYRQN